MTANEFLISKGILTDSWTTVPFTTGPGNIVLAQLLNEYHDKKLDDLIDSDFKGSQKKENKITKDATEERTTKQEILKALDKLRDDLFKALDEKIKIAIYNYEKEKLKSNI